MRFSCRPSVLENLHSSRNYRSVRQGALGKHEKVSSPQKYFLLYNISSLLAEEYHQFCMKCILSHTAWMLCRVCQSRVEESVYCTMAYMYSPHPSCFPLSVSPLSPRISCSHSKPWFQRWTLKEAHR